MKPEHYTDADLRLAILDASDQRSIFISTAHELEDIDSSAVRSLRTLLAHLPEPVTDDWQECRFEDVRDTDEHVRFEFSDGSIIQGKPHQRTRTDIELWTGYAITAVSLTISKKGKAAIYRIPKKIVHPDPAQHPVIIDEAGRPWFSAGLDEYHSPHQHSIFRNPRDFENWTPAKVVEDDR